MHQRLYFALDLKDDLDLIAAYEAHHAPGQVPAPITASIRDSGIVEMEIFRTGNRLIMVAEVNSNYDPIAKAAADATNPAVQDWEILMETFQQSLPWAPEGTKWVPLHRIFALSEQ